MSIVPAALQETVTVPLWLLLALAGYHRAVAMLGKAYREERRRQDTRRQDGGGSP